MSVTLDKVYESSAEKRTVVLWVSRHPPLPSQIDVLERKLGGVVVYQLAGIIPNAEAVIEYVKKLNATVVVPVLPLSIIARLAELAKSTGFTILLAKMEAIAATKDPEEVKRLVSENPWARTITTYADGVIRVFEFRCFERLIRVELVTEPF